MIAGTIAGSISATLLFPLDLIKVRYQVRLPINILMNIFSGILIDSHNAMMLGV